MSDVERLEGAFRSGALVGPAGGPGLVDLTRALARWGGIDDLPGDGAVAAIESDFGDPSHLVFVFADGFGTCFLEHAPELKAKVARELRTIFPSSTAPALTTVATAEWPSRHGILGWWTYLEAIDDAASILPFHRRRDGAPLRDLGVTIEEVTSTPPIGHRMTKPVLTLKPERYVASVYSLWAAGGTTAVGYGELSEAADRAIEHVARADGSSYTYLYWPAIDHAAHVHGCGSAELKAAVALLEAEVVRLARAIGPRGRVVVSSDHGHLDMRPDGSDRIGPEDPLAGCFRSPPSGDARAMVLHLLPERAAEFDAAFRERFGERYALLTVEEARSLGLLGPDDPSPQARRRMGDRFALSLGADTLVYIDGPESIGVADRVVSAHSGLSPAEMMIPLIVM